MTTVRVLFCIFLFLSHAWGAFAEEIVIEAGAGGKNSDQYSEPEGVWTESRTPPASAKSGAPGLTPRGECGSRKILFWRTSGQTTTAPASARFTPRLQSPGRYFVYATWTSAANAQSVRYLVRHAGGETLLRLNQDGRGAAGAANADKWIPLGSYSFAPDAGHFVELRLEQETGPVTRKAFGQIVADAVKFTSDAAGGDNAPSPIRLDSSTDGSGTGAETASSSSPRPVWVENLQEAQAAARERGKKIFVFFYLPGSASCREYEEKLFSNGELNRILSRDFIATRLNLEENTSLATALRVYRAGTINLYDSQGNAVGQIAERMEPEELVKRLREITN